MSDLLPCAFLHHDVRRPVQSDLSVGKCQEARPGVQTLRQYTRDDSAVTRSQAGRDAGTAERILDVAERLVQRRGFNAFSYADVANELGVTKPSVHYHFPGKGELGEALIKRYALRFETALADIDANG